MLLHHQGHPFVRGLVVDIVKSTDMQVCDKGTCVNVYVCVCVRVRVRVRVCLCVRVLCVCTCFGGLRVELLSLRSWTSSSPPTCR